MAKKGRIQKLNLIDYPTAAKSLSLKEKVGQFFMPAAFINDSEEEILKLQDLISKHHIGGLCFFHSRASAATNYEGKKEVVYNEDSYRVLKNLIERYQQVAKYPLLISIDAEWGLAMRVENTPQYPYAITLGAIDSHDETITEVGRNIANDCKQAGIHWNFTPVADINSNPENPVIGYRSFGSDKYNVANKASALAKGLQSIGILASAKHFPGHGDTATDSHLGLPLINKSKEELLDNELYPFKHLIQNGIDSIMVGHLAVPSLAGGSMDPSSISKRIIKGVLREEMEFQGVVVSDALNMRAVSKMFSDKGDLEWAAFDAGNDILCFAEHVVEGIDNILQNAQDEQIELSFARVWKLKEKAFNNESDNLTPKLVDPTDLNLRLAKHSITLHKGSPKDINSLAMNGFAGIEISNGNDNSFFRDIKKELEFDYFSTTEFNTALLREKVSEMQNVLIALYPPMVKPQNNFGISEEYLMLLREMIETKNVVLYLFGNPYALRVFDYKNTSAVVLVYQEFGAFQKVAAEHFLGRLIANGKLPVVL
ncbi:glycoside hydrolase family 3 N-terminal domain-containing protein [uncultured Eudoraea sp.]|uniref:glycoside hydrolase family 3 protein n=1 Tax=uncultured Eudoraea sp. TaxID=1035614 RepID=UPI002623542C|nr:glycoside hydrolase family 3 N-terminal domain-containing protein [uncultured Eudoraea sp.]